MGSEWFESAALRFQGEGPILKLKNSSLSKSSGVTLVEGEVDLRRLGQRDFFRKIKLSSMERSLNLNGWQMTPTPGTQGLTLRRPASEEAEGPEP